MFLRFWEVVKKVVLGSKVVYIYFVYIPYIDSSFISYHVMVGVRVRVAWRFTSIVCLLLGKKKHY